MDLGESDIRALATLARLRLTDAEVERAAAELARLLAYIERMMAVDTTGAAEAAHAGERSMALRADVARPGLPRALALRGAPSADSGLFEVPRLLGERPAAEDAS